MSLPSNRGVAKGGPGTACPIPLKILRIKRVRTTHALRITHALHIRLMELWMSWMNWELRSINFYELMGYFGLQLARLFKNLVLRWRQDLLPANQSGFRQATLQKLPFCGCCQTFSWLSTVEMWLPWSFWIFQLHSTRLIMRFCCSVYRPHLFLDTWISLKQSVGLVEKAPMLKPHQSVHSFW